MQVEEYLSSYKINGEVMNIDEHIKLAESLIYSL